MMDINEIVSVLTEEQKQVLKDCITFGGWGDGDMEFLTAEGDVGTFGMYGYYTNDAQTAGNFKGRKVSALFRGIYTKLCSKEYGYKVGHVLSHCRDWWGDGTGDMLFIKEDYVDDFEKWAKT